MVAVAMIGVRATAEDEAVALRGRWRPISIITEGLKANLESAPPMLWDFDGNQVHIFREGKELVALKIRFDRTENPKRFDASYEGNDPDLRRAYHDDIHGIYEIESGRLRRCFALRGGPRPVAFEAGKGSGNQLIVLERITNETVEGKPK